MPSGLDEDLGLLSYWPDDMPSSHLDSSDSFGHLGHLSHLGYLNILDPKPIDIPLHAFIEEEGST
jgi:hypothetical protein